MNYEDKMFLVSLLGLFCMVVILATSIAIALFLAVMYVAGFIIITIHNFEFLQYRPIKCCLFIYRWVY